VREVPVEDPGVLTDLDTPEDYAGARGVPES
jgi:CTP:molybdopterin cytidylyltransferase MocA